MRFIGGILALALFTGALATPKVTSLSERSLPANGRLIVHGDGFGKSGTLLIGNRGAIVTRWSDSAIHGYVPHQLTPGTAEVRVTNADGRSKPVRFEIAPRQFVDGSRVLWRFQTDRWMNRQFIEVDETRRVYTSDHTGLYALSPSGDLLWFAPGSGGDLPIDSSSNGIVYSSVALSVGPEIIRAHDRDGNIIWTFTSPQPGRLFAGPNVGPDGNIYAVQEVRGGSGIGLFALSPSGNLLWSNLGDPVLGTVDGDISINEIIFSEDRLYFSIIRQRSGGSGVTYSFDLVGNQQWHTGTGDLHLPFYRFPRLDPFGRVIGARGQTGAMAINEDGSVAWQKFHPGSPNVIEMPAVDSFGNSYFHDWLGIEMWSLDPAGNTRWVTGFESNLFTIGVGISPDDQVLVHTGVEDFAAEGFIRGINPNNGAINWRLDFEPENGIHQRSNNLYPVFAHVKHLSRTGARDQTPVYVTTLFSDVNAVTHGYLYAINYR